MNISIICIVQYVLTSTCYFCFSAYIVVTSK